MGNRAVITTKEKTIGVYVHWNGGRDSIEAFLMYCRLVGYRSPTTDCYGWARLCQVIANFFGDSGLSVGIDVYDRLDKDNGDNGVYIIDGWDIVAREFFDYEEQHEYKLWEMLEYIDSRQPTQIGLEELQKRYIKLFFKTYNFTEHEKQTIEDITDANMYLIENPSTNSWQLEEQKMDLKANLLYEDFRNTDLELTRENLYKIFSVNWLLPF